MTAFPPTRRAPQHWLGVLSISVILIVCAGLTIGLTFAPCYSSDCVEQWFSSETRVHLAVFYSVIGTVAIYLAVWSRTKALRTFANRYLWKTPLPLIGSRLSVGGLLAISWFLGGAEIHWPETMFRVPWTGVTGHWCDIAFGLVFLPVRRNSLLASVFHVHASPLLLAHTLLAYALFALGLVHGLIYYSFVSALVAKRTGEPVSEQLSADKPYHTKTQAQQIGPYGDFVLPTGAISGIVLIPVMLVTALPVLRRRSHNIFYFVHIIAAQLVLVLLCIHASTDFYCVLPDMLLWVYEWVNRLRCSLLVRTEVEVESAGHGWYRMRLPESAKHPLKDAVATEKGLAISDSISAGDPFQTFYIRLGVISKVEIHPFTAAATESSSSGPVLLFQKSPARKKAVKSDKEWSWRLGTMVDQSPPSVIWRPLARIEGPYIASTPELFTADHVLAIVGGTGITGALSLANWWLSRQSTPSTIEKHFRIVWTIREAEMADLAEIQALRLLVQSVESRADLLIHVSSEAGRLSPADALNRFLTMSQDKLRGQAFIYISGPAGLSADAEEACVRRRTELRAKRGSDKTMEIDWYFASYAV